MPKKLSQENKPVSNYELQHIRNGWLVIVKEDHGLKGAWFFKDRKSAEKFTKDFKPPGQERKKKRKTSSFSRGALLLFCLLFFLILVLLLQ